MRSILSSVAAMLMEVFRRVLSPSLKRPCPLVMFTVRTLDMTPFPPCWKARAKVELREHVTERDAKDVVDMMQEVREIFRLGPASTTSTK